MDEDRFWLIVNKISNNTICNINLTKDEVLKFHTALEEKLVESYRFSLMEICFVICSYISDDIFEEFQAYLILKGKEKFHTIIKDPEAIVNWLDKLKSHDIEKDGEKLLSFSLEKYIELGGNENDFYTKITYLDKPNVNINWAESKKEYIRRYPDVVEKFWNQKLIDELH